MDEIWDAVVIARIGRKGERVKEREKKKSREIGGKEGQVEEKKIKGSVCPWICSLLS